MRGASDERAEASQDALDLSLLLGLRLAPVVAKLYDGQRLDETSAAKMYTAKPGQLDGYYGDELPCMYKAQRKLKK